MIRKTSLLNLASGITLQVITAISGLVLPSLILHTYGSVLNGLVSMVTQMMAYLSLVEMGITAASLVSLYKPMASKDYELASSIFSAVNRFYHRVALIFAAGSIGGGFLVMLVNKDDIPVSTIWFIVFALSGSNFVSYWFLNKYKVLLRASDKLYIINLSQIVGTIVQFICSVCIIHRRYNIGVLKALIIGINILEWLILLTYCKRHFPKISVHVTPKFDAIKQRKDVLIHQVLSLVLNNTDVLLLSVFSASLSIVSIYTTYNLVLTLIYNVANTIIGMFSSHMNQMYSIGEKEKVKAILDKYEIVFDTVLFGLYISMALLVLPFISLYTRGVTDAEYYNPSIGLLFSIYGITRMIRLPYTELTYSVGNYKETKNQAIIEALINIVVSIALLPSFGIPGVLIGSIAGEIYRTIHSYIFCYQKVLTFDWQKSVLLTIVDVALFVAFYAVFEGTRKEIFETYYGFFVRAITVGLIVILSVAIINICIGISYKHLKQIINKGNLI